MLVGELFDLSENTKLNQSDLIKIDLLIEAINDWPKGLVSIDEFLKELQNDQNVESITLQSTEQRSKMLKVNNDAWKMESYESLIKLIRLCNGESLNNILSDIINLYGTLSAK